MSMSSSLLQQLSAERAALIATLTPRSWAIGGSSGRTVSAIHWRGPYLIGAAEPLGDVEQVHLYAPPARGQPDTPSPPDGQGEVVAAELSTDIAVVRVNGPVRTNGPVATARPAESALSEPQRFETLHSEPLQSESLRLGESVAIVGRDRHGALALWSSVRVAGPAWRSRRGGQIDQRLEFAADLDERWEGALVATAAGRIVAMAVRGPRGRLLGIPAATIERVISRVERQGYLPRPYLGLRLQALFLDGSAVARLGRNSRRIPVVAGVDPDSPAAAAGVTPGDLIDRIDDQEISGVDGLQEVLGRISVGQTLRLALLRGGVAEVRTLAVAERPRLER